MTLRLYVPDDSAARSVGADRVAKALADEAGKSGVPIEIRRNGSRGLFWLEPLVEVATDRGRIAFGPVKVSDVPGLLEAIIAGTNHPLALGLTEEISYLKRQQRLTFARIGVIEPLSLSDYQANDGFRGLAKALAMQPAEIVEEVVASGLRGRGGAGFPTGIKWRTVAGLSAPQKYVVCNADEGDSGTFADRMVMEDDPYMLIEGMTIAGLAVGANKGVIYIRSEYPSAVQRMREAIRLAKAAGHMPDFDLDVRVGAGAYICGEETSLLESVEGKRAQVRAKPPIPAIKGLFDKPSVINNVLSFAAIPWILQHGGKAYADYGMGRSRGTMPLQLAGNIKRGGIFETAFGLSLREVIEDIGGGTISGRPVRAVQVGGPLGAYFPQSLLDTKLDYEAMLAVGGMLGHGGMVVFDDTVDMAAQARFAFAFCAAESCGKCTPCRIGSTRGVETIDKIRLGFEPEKNIELVKDLCTVMTDGSLCALGGLTGLPVMSALEHFGEDFGPQPKAVAAE